MNQTVSKHQATVAFFTLMFTLDKARELLEVEGYIVRSTIYRDIWGMIAVNPRLKQVRIVEIREASPRESIPQSIMKSAVCILK